LTCQQNAGSDEMNECPECGVHFLDKNSLRKHIWYVHLDALEKVGLLISKRDYSKIKWAMPKKIPEIN